MNERSVVIDTNLFVLLIVGATSQDYIDKHKRTNIYSREDFELLEFILSSASKIIITPNVLSEASNLLRQFKEPGVTQIMKKYMEIVEFSTEIYIPSTKAVRRQEFSFIGLTDAALLEIESDQALLITDDLDLYCASVSLGRQTVNFSHEREKWLQV